MKCDICCKTNTRRSNLSYVVGNVYLHLKVHPVSTIHQLIKLCFFIFLQCFNESGWCSCFCLVFYLVIIIFTLFYHQYIFMFHHHHITHKFTEFCYLLRNTAWTTLLLQKQNLRSSFAFITQFTRSLITSITRSVLCTMVVCFCYLLVIVDIVTTTIYQLYFWHLITTYLICTLNFVLYSLFLLLSPLDLFYLEYCAIPNYHEGARRFLSDVHIFTLFL